MEKRFAAARGSAGAPWAERRQGLREAERAAEGRLQRHVAEHLDVLLAEIAQDAEDVAKRVNRAAIAFVEAHAARVGAENQLIAALAQVSFPPRPHAVTVSRAEAAVRAVARFMDEGGESPPKVRPGVLPARDAETGSA